MTTHRPENRSLSILVVDDNPTNRLIVRSFLEKHGHRVSIARSGHEAVTLATKPWDLVFMDINMPGMDGFEAATKMLGQSEHLVVFALTAQNSEETHGKAAESGMRGVIAKPLSAVDLLGVLEEIDGDSGGM